MNREASRGADGKKRQSVDIRTPFQPLMSAKPIPNPGRQPGKSELPPAFTVVPSGRPEPSPEDSAQKVEKTSPSTATSTATNPNSAPTLQGPAFYRHALELLDGSGIPYLLGGAFATGTYTGVLRDTKDLDCMVRQEDVGEIMDLFASKGFRVEHTFPHWLAKVFHGEYFVDLIYSAGNGLCPVDEEWFTHSRTTHVAMLDRDVRICPPEEIIWQKAYIMERERFDGADVIHLIRGVGRKLDWDRLLRRFGDDWRVIFSHVVMFGFVYPGERDKIPVELMEHFARKLAEDAGEKMEDEHLCKGTFLSRAQYLPDLEHWGYTDARLVNGRTHMTEGDVKLWTAGIEPQNRPM
jgi:hypothetical protein